MQIYKICSFYFVKDISNIFGTLYFGIFTLFKCKSLTLTFIQQNDARSSVFSVAQQALICLKLTIKILEKRACKVFSKLAIKTPEWSSPYFTGSSVPAANSLVFNTVHIGNILTTTGSTKAKVVLKNICLSLNLILSLLTKSLRILAISIIWVVFIAAHSSQKD